MLLCPELLSPFMFLIVRVCVCMRTPAFTPVSLSLCDFAPYCHMHVLSPSTQLGSSGLLQFTQVSGSSDRLGRFPPILEGASGMHRLFQPMHSVCLSSIPQGQKYQRPSRQMVQSPDNGCAPGGGSGPHGIFHNKGRQRGGHSSMASCHPTLSPFSSSLLASFVLASFPTASSYILLYFLTPRPNFLKNHPSFLSNSGFL